MCIASTFNTGKTNPILAARSISFTHCASRKEKHNRVKRSRAIIHEPFRYLCKTAGIVLMLNDALVGSPSEPQTGDATECSTKQRMKRGPPWRDFRGAGLY